MTAGRAMLARLVPAGPGFSRPRILALLVVLALAVAATVVTVASFNVRRAAAEQPAPKPRGFNGTFESGTSGWIVTGSASLVHQAGGHRGTSSARVTNTGEAATTVVLNDAVNTISPTVAGTTYTASAWVRTDRPDATVNLRLMEFRPGQAGVAEAQSQRHVWLRDTRWHRIFVTHKAEGSGNSLDLNVLGWELRPGASFDVDDVAVKTAGASPRKPGTKNKKTEAAGEQPALPKQPSTTSLPKPGQGAVFGFWQSGGASVRGLETRAKMRFGAVHRYRDFNGAALWPSAEEIQLGKEGRMLHFSWETMSYNGGHDAAMQPAPAGRARDSHNGGVRKMWKYRQITSGSMDRYLDTIAGRVKVAGVPMLIDFNHEMDDLPDVGGSNTMRAATGTRAEYAAAYRHIVNRFRAQGVTNVTWGWTTSGWYANDKSKWWSYQQLWPGKGYVDVIMWDPYNATKSRWRSFTKIASKFYDALDAGMLDKVDPSAKSLRRGLGEFGSVADPRRPAWLRSLPKEIRKMPKLVYVNYYSSGSWGALHDDPAAVRALADAVNDPYFRR